jgi:3-phenylpropionate/trans-cinnamate dioxygenase ferredoxin subunit
MADVPPGETKSVMLDGQPVCVANAEGEFFAVTDRCTHANIPLSGSALVGRQIVCPWHGAMFDLKDGRPTCGPASDGLRCYDVSVEGEDLVVSKRESLFED